jgi:hypothetical protein
VRCFAAGGLAGAFLATPAAAIVGGEPENGPIARHIVHVGICSGIALSFDVVLTAAHCVGGHVRWRDADGATHAAAPDAVAVHPQFQPYTDARQVVLDLALLKWTGGLPAAYRPASLGEDVLWRGDTAVMTGFGESQQGQADTAGTLRSVESVVITPFGFDERVAWLGRDTPAGACRGDSGGALTKDGRVVGVLVSIVGRCGHRTRAVMLAPQRQWIDATLAGWGRRAEWATP